MGLLESFFRVYYGLKLLDCPGVRCKRFGYSNFCVLALAEYLVRLFLTELYFTR
jgi:hypothetical protein